MMEVQELPRKFEAEPSPMHVQNFPRALNYVVSQIFDKILSHITKDAAFSEQM
jgi:hypothetical protein